MSRPRLPGGRGWQKIAEVRLADLITATDPRGPRRPAIERMREQTGLDLETVARFVWTMSRRSEGTSR